GKRGGRVKVRAKIKQLDKKTLVITEIPFGTTTSSLIDSIIKANDKGKIKIKKIEDNTAENVEIVIHLAPGISPDKMIDALYAFTDCEISISPNACVIFDDKPLFLSVQEILKLSTERTKQLLKQELEIKLGELQEQWHFSSLEKIFIEEKIYIEFDGKTYEEAMALTHERLKPHAHKFYRAITDEDVKKLMEIKMRRITKHDSEKADTYIASLEDEMKKVQYNLEHLTEFAIDYFKHLKQTYGKNITRKTEIKTFENIEATKVAVANVKLYVNREEGFAGYALRRGEGEFVCDCSDIDDIIVIREDGKMIVSKISQKAFFGKKIKYIGVWKKGDKRKIYNLIYRDGNAGYVYAKRFAVTSITRDKEYDLTQGTKGSKILYLSVNPNGEAETVQVILRQKAKLKKLKFDYDFSQLAIKGRGAKGNIVTKHAVNKILLKEEGTSTLGARKIWFDDTVMRLNTEGRGEFLGEFKGDDKILTVYQSGEYKLTGFDLNTHFDDDLILIEKWNPEKPLSAIYYNGEKKAFYIKRFLVENSDKKSKFIPDDADSYLEFVSYDWKPQIQLHFAKVKGKERNPETINVEEFIAVKGWKAIGNKLSPHKIKSIDALEPLPAPEKENIPENNKNSEENSETPPNLELNIQTNNPSTDNKEGNQITLDLL
ncbi:MAG: DNA gyrase/topoisomerase IV subunit A, partial [Bacteroidetes bacterium]